MRDRVKEGVELPSSFELPDMSAVLCATISWLCFKIAGHERLSLRSTSDQMALALLAISSIAVFSRFVPLVFSSAPP